MNCWLTPQAPTVPKIARVTQCINHNEENTHRIHTVYTHTHTQTHTLRRDMCAHTSFVNFSILQHVCQTRHEGWRELFECAAYESTDTHTHICVYNCMEAIVSTCQRLKSQWTNDDRTTWSRMETEFDSELNFLNWFALNAQYTQPATHSYTPSHTYKYIK